MYKKEIIDKILNNEDDNCSKALTWLYQNDRTFYNKIEKPCRNLITAYRVKNILMQNDNPINDLIYKQVLQDIELYKEELECYA